MLVTADDVEALKDRCQDEILRGPDQGPGIRGVAQPIFDRLVEAIEPNLVFTEAGSAVEWFEAITKARPTLGRSINSATIEHLEKVARVTRKYQKLLGAAPQRAFAFFKDADFRRVAEEDWSRAVAAGQREDAKTAAIAGGSVVEAIALDILTRLATAEADRLRDHLNGLPAPARRNLLAKKQPDDWSFAFLLLALGPDGLQVLTERTHEIGHTLRDWRNFVHPGKAKTEAPLSAADGRLAVAFAEKVIEEAAGWDAAGAKLIVP
jgi:hypothetical protein